MPWWGWLILACVGLVVTGWVIVAVVSTRAVSRIGRPIDSSRGRPYGGRR